MNYRLNKYSERLNQTIYLDASKSESNRVLLIDALSESSSNLENLAIARDTTTMTRLLKKKGRVWNVLDAGTTMRFLTAYLGINGTGEIITGTERMKNRPIGSLVDCLRKVGAAVSYLEREGYPPLQIEGVKKQAASKISIPGNISSQYISALLMIAPTLENGLEVELTTEVFSRPYIEMTLGLMEHFGVSHEWQGQTIKIPSTKYLPNDYTVEGDWSGASYWYSVVALAPKGSELTLSYLKPHSYQGDSIIAEIMQSLGVSSVFSKDSVILKNDLEVQGSLNLDFKDCPDLAQTVMVAASALGCKLHLTGLESLRIKETDRIAAMQNELGKMGAELTEENHTWTLKPTQNMPDFVSFHTYEDHRMAMALAPLYQVSSVEIENPEVVNKSYPSFWVHLRSVGVQMTELPG